MKKENNPIIVTSIIAGVVLLIALAALFVYGGNDSMRDTVNVQGVSTIDVVPDLVSVYFYIETKGETSSEANDKNTEIYNDLVVALLSNDFSRSEIGIDNYQVYPDVDWSNGNPKNNGFIAVRSVKVKMNANESERLYSVVDSGINAGAGINFINFELSSELESKSKAEALELASKDARIKAEAVARGFGKNVGSLVSVSVNDYGYYPWTAYSKDSGSEDPLRVAAESMTPSSREITSTISAIYKIY